MSGGHPQPCPPDKAASCIPRKGGGFGRESFGDPLENAVRIAQDVVVPEAQDAVAFGFEEAGAFGVVFRSARMLPAIDLDNELGGVGAEIDSVAAERSLLSPVDIGQCRTHGSPKHALGFGHGTPEPARTFNCDRRESQPPKALPFVGRVGWGRVICASR